MYRMPVNSCDHMLRYLTLSSPHLQGTGSKKLSFSDRWHRRMRKLVTSHSFDMFFALVVVSNSVFMGIEVVTWNVETLSCCWEGPRLGLATCLRVQKRHGKCAFAKDIGHLGRKHKKTSLVSKVFLHFHNLSEMQVWGLYSTFVFLSARGKRHYCKALVWSIGPLKIFGQALHIIHSYRMI